MDFDKNNYTIENIEVDGNNFTYRAFRNISYVAKPVNPDFQQMNIFVPEAYYQGEAINGYTKSTAPVFMPNHVGGYKPGGLGNPECFRRDGRLVLNTILRALMRGYIVAIPAIRGRDQQGEDGEYNGKAPACIVDYKAAVRFLHFYRDELPGDMNKIITNGTSAGGALSSLMGATGNHPDYESYLQELGAADAGDEIFAASCYCPITNLEHADMAYEWEFCGEDEYNRVHGKQENGQWTFTRVDGRLTNEQIQLSKELKALFPAYLNSLGLKAEDGTSLTLDEEGNGSFKEYMKSVILESANRAIRSGIDVSKKEWLTIEDGKAVATDWEAYVHDISRMKVAPAFDDLTLKSPENDLFGSDKIYARHFTRFGAEHSHEGGALAEEAVIKMLNPMNYINDKATTMAKHWRIRHGECDRDTSLAISAILTLKLKEAGCDVDYHAPWDVPHAGDYDLEELFEWIDSICQS